MKNRITTEARKHGGAFDSEDPLAKVVLIELVGARQC